MMFLLYQVVIYEYYNNLIVIMLYLCGVNRNTLFQWRKEIMQLILLVVLQ